MASSNEKKLTEQQSNNRNPTMPPTPTITVTPSVDTAGDQTQDEKEVEVLTPATHATSAEDYHSEQAQGGPNQVEASTTAMAIPVGGINPQQQSPMGAVTVAPLQRITTTPENYAADDSHHEEQSSSGSYDGGDEEQTDSDSGDAGGGEKSGSDSGDGDDEKPGSDSGDDDGDEEERSDSASGGAGDEEKSDSDSGDAGGGEKSGSDSRDGDDEKQSSSDSGDDSGDEEQSDSDSGGDGENEEEEEKEGPENDEELNIDDEVMATPTDVNTEDRGNNSSSTPASVEIDHRDPERSDPATPDLTSGSSEEDDDGPTTPFSIDHGSPSVTTSAGSDHVDEDARSPVTATSPGPENGDGKSNISMAPASTTSDDGNVNSSQTQKATGVSFEKQAAEENDSAVSSDVASEEDAPASSQEDEDMKSDFEEDEISETSGLPTEVPPRTISGERGAQESAVTPDQGMEEAASEPDMEACHGEEEIELTGSEGPLLRAEIPESPLRTTSGEREAQETAVTPDQDMEEAASEPDMEACHGEEEIELTGSEGPLLPSEIPESPTRPGPGSPRNEDSEHFGIEQREAQGQAFTPAQDLEGTPNQPDAMIYAGQEDDDRDSLEIPETPLPPRGRLSEDPNDFDLDEGEAVPIPEYRVSLFTGYQRSEVNGEDTQEPAGTSEQDFDDSASEPEWDSDYIEAEDDESLFEDPEITPQSAQRLGENPSDFDLDEGEEVSNPVDRVALLTGYLRSEANGEDDQADGDQGGESSIERNQSKGKSSGFGQVPSYFGSDDPIGKPDGKDGKAVHLRIQYLVACSKRSKASMCISVPADIPYTVFRETILNALHQHDGTKNPRPAHIEAVISRLLLVMAGSKPTELTNDNLQQNLVLMPQRSIYDFVKVEFVPETNGETRRRKATGKVNGRSGKVGGL